jgi:hypothetical protein
VSVAWAESTNFWSISIPPHVAPSKKCLLGKSFDKRRGSAPPETIRIKTQCPYGLLKVFTALCWLARAGAA